MRKVNFYLLCALLLFLPVSSWLVSLSGSNLVSLLRDAIVFLVAIISLSKIKKPLRKDWVFWLAVLFIFWGVISFFWREASAMQWLKGFRFTFLPVILFLSLSNLDFTQEQKKVFYKIIMVSGVLISAMAILEFFGVKLPLTSSLSSSGALESTHFVGALKIQRLQSVLAGPNAFGLYLLALLAYSVGVFKEISKRYFLIVLLFLILLLLTFSRSAWLGALIILLIIFKNYLKANLGGWKTFLIILAVVAGLVSSGLLLYRVPKIGNLITHNDSSSLRYEQYKRIWNQRGEIGLLGRGSGTAGPSSQYRLDGGENHWTENVYLDIFEELGLVGMTLYLALIILISVKSFQIKNKYEKITTSTILISFAVSGLFINYYTGQVGLFLMWFAAGLLLPKGEK